MNQLLVHRKACRQLDDKSGPAEGRFVVGSNDPIVCFNDRPGDRQAQAHAGFFGRKEAVEQTRQMLRVDAGAAVFDDAAYSLRIDFTSFEATRQHHIGSSPHPDRYDPDTWTDEYAFLTHPGQADIQTTLLLDYRTNVASYPRWQNRLRAVQPPTLVVWGKYNPSFTVAGATAYAGDVPKAEIHMLEAEHFALDEATDEIASLVRDFLERLALNKEHG